MIPVKFGKVSPGNDSVPIGLYNMAARSPNAAALLETGVLLRELNDGKGSNEAVMCNRRCVIRQDLIGV